MEALIVKVLAVLVGINVVLSAVSAGLAKIVDQTEALRATDKDNKALAIVQKGACILQKIVDFLSANRPHKPQA